MATPLRTTWLMVLLMFAGSGWAANVTVTANANLTFTPSTVTINAGDTVTFTNAGGGFHNVHADDNAFRCANGCVSTGGNGNPSSSNWSFTLSFPNAGTVGYYCEIHGAPGAGMHGRIVVNAVTPPPFVIGGYMSGNWYNPLQGGHGFQLEFTTLNNGALAIWFVYTPDGSGQNWIYSQGSYDPTKNTVTLPAILEHGAKFPPNFNPADVKGAPPDPLWGSLTFTFSDCNHGTVSWHSDFPGYNMANDMPLAIQRLTQIAGTTCPP